MSTEDVFGIPFWVGNEQKAIDAVRDWLATSTGHFTLAFANPEFLLTAERDESLRRYLHDCRAVFADGIGIVWASRLQGGAIRDRITGTDFQWRIFELAAELDLSLFIYGGKPGVAARAVERIRARLPGLARIDCHHGYGDAEDTAARIAAFRPAIVMVCLGNPLQEQWITRHAQASGARMLFGNGGSVDFIAGEVRRAPDWMLQTGFEWLWRLAQDLTWRRIRRQARLSYYLARLLKLWLRRR